MRLHGIDSEVLNSKGSYGWHNEKSKKKLRGKTWMDKKSGLTHCCLYQNIGRP